MPKDERHSGEYHHPSLSRPRCLGRAEGVLLDPDEHVYWEHQTLHLLPEVREGENYRKLPSVNWIPNPIPPSAPRAELLKKAIRAFWCPSCGGRFPYIALRESDPPPVGSRLPGSI
jgi:hypothetical protein